MTITISTSCYSYLIMDTIDPEFTIAALGSFLCHKLPYAFEQLSLYSTKLYIYRYYYTNVFSIIYLCFAYFLQAISKWCSILEYYPFIIFIVSCGCFYLYFSSSIWWPWISKYLYIIIKNKLEFSIKVFNSVWLLVLYAPPESSLFQPIFLS